LLFEAVLALSLFVAAGVAILGLLDQSAARMDSVRDSERAADLARSAMSRIEAGIVEPEAMVGPIQSWTGDPDAEEPVDDRSAPQDSGWEYEIDSAPSQFPGLSTVTVRAVRHPASDPERVLASYTLRQLVRLGSRDEDSIGDEDEVAQRARQIRERSGGTRPDQRGGPP